MTLAVHPAPTATATPPPGAATLVITRGPGLTGPVEIPIGSDPVVIGRHQDCDIVLADLTISRRHAEIRRAGGTFQVTDLDSLNGTFVNRKPINATDLSSGDTVWIGRYRLEFRTGPARDDEEPAHA